MLIELEELKHKINNSKYYGTDAWRDILDMAIDCDSKSKSKGEWLNEDGDKVEIDDNGITEGSCWCSVCGEWLVASDEYPTKGSFCPNCGADMRGEDDG